MSILECGFIHSPNEYLAVMKLHVSVKLLLKNLSELLNQLQASRLVMKRTGAIVASLPLNSRDT